MIDLNCHILDGVQGGPSSFAGSLEMCQAAAAGGVKTIVATPRWEAGRAEPPLPFDECWHKLERLESEARGGVSLKLGFTLQFSHDLPALVERYGSKLALAGKRHLLVSLPSLEMPEGTERVWEDLSRAGYSVLIAHPECNTKLRRDTRSLERWISEGLKIQIDAKSVMGAHGREARRFAIECLRKYEGQVVVASNARWDAVGKNHLGAVRDQLMGIVGTRRARRLFRETPAALIGEAVNEDGGRGVATNGVASLLRSFNPIKMLMASRITDGE